MSDDAVLENWISLNKAVRHSDIPTCERLLAAEIAGRGRLNFILRINSRLNRLRGEESIRVLRERFAK